MFLSILRVLAYYTYIDTQKKERMQYDVELVLQLKLSEVRDSFLATRMMKMTRLVVVASRNLMLVLRLVPTGVPIRESL